ncbi:MAG: hypothetical protein AAGA92_00955 [Planctomycetota bacterium]
MLTWKTSTSASCSHAARVIGDGLEIVDTQLAAELLPQAEGLLRATVEYGDNAEALLRALGSLSAQFENNRELARAALVRVFGQSETTDARVSTLAAAVASLESTMMRQRPKLAEELVARTRPLREQWEARGPGLLKAMHRLAGAQLTPDSAEVVLVAPLAGGHGYAYPITNRVVFEGLLTDARPDLAETLRLGWLLAQLNADLPAVAEAVGPLRAARASALATVPVALAASEDLGLAAGGVEMLPAALEAWHCVPGDPAPTAEALHNWWNTYRDSVTGWPVAVAALDQMLAEQS